MFQRAIFCQRGRGRGPSFEDLLGISRGLPSKASRGPRSAPDSRSDFWIHGHPELSSLDDERELAGLAGVGAQQGRPRRHQGRLELSGQRRFQPSFQRCSVS